MDYENFDIRIAKSVGSDAYQMSVQSSVLAYLDDSFEIPYVVADAALRNRIQFNEDGLLAQAGDVQALGIKLRNRLFPGDVWTYFDNCRQEVMARNRGLRIRLIIDTAAAALGQLPWEYCFHDDFKFIGLNDQTPIVRFLPTGRRPRNLKTERPRLLVAVASPDNEILADLYELNIKQRLAEIFEPLKPFIDYKLMFNTTLQMLTEEVDKGYDIFQFFGHAAAPTGKKPRIFLEKAGRVQHTVEHGELTQLLANKFKLCVLTACETTVHDPGDMFTGLAQNLVKTGIPAVIGMQLKIEQQAATEFTSHFYTALSTGSTVDEALIKARRLAYAGDNRHSLWGIPVLYLQTENARIWTDSDAQELAEATTELVRRSQTATEEPEDARPKPVDELLMALYTLNFTKQLRTLRLVRRDSRANAVVLSSGEAADIDGLYWLRNVLIRDVRRKTRKDARKVNLKSRMTAGNTGLIWNDVALGCKVAPGDPALVAEAAVEQLGTHSMIFALEYKRRRIDLDTLLTEFWSHLADCAGRLPVEQGDKQTSVLLFILDTDNELATRDHQLLKCLPAVEPIAEDVFYTWYNASEHLFPDHMQDSEVAEHILYGGRNGYHLQNPEGYVDDLLANMDRLCSGILAHIGK